MKRSTRTDLLALAVGLGVAVGMLALILWLTNDMRWILGWGGGTLFAAGLWLGTARRGGALGFVLLCGPLIGLYALLVLPQLPALWGHLALWTFFAALGWWGFRSSFRSSSRRSGVPRAAALPAALLVAGVGLGWWYGGWFVPDAISRALNEVRNEPAPEFALTRLDGAPYPGDALRGKVVVLDFFATWCAPCVAELPAIEALHARYDSAPDVEIVVVANDSGGDTPESIRAFVESRVLEVPFAYDHGGTAHRAFGFAGLPGLVVIDRDHRVRFVREGYNAAEKDFEENLVEIIEELRGG